MKKKIENILPPPVDKCNLSFKNLAAFTLAEILLSLTVIGIVAAIALPSLLGNANERAWETQKKALYTRFSQAIPLLPSLNGYGQLEGTLSDGENEQNVTVDTAAESFVRDGLSKVMKITNICDSEHLTDCGLPDKIIPLEGNVIELSNIKTLGVFNPIITNMSYSDANNSVPYNYEQLDTKAASFETVNGESILVYYNPNCEPYLENDLKDVYYIQPKLCANFVYDLNGKKGPNTVGKDIGFISAIYSTDPVVVSPNPYRKVTGQNLIYEDAVTKCKEMGEEIKVPSLYEMMSIVYNKQLVVSNKTHFWTSTAYSSTQNWRVSTNTGRNQIYNKTTSTVGNVYCIKR